MNRRVNDKIYKALAILGLTLLIMALIVIVLFLTNNFHINDLQYEDSHGIYDSALTGLPAFFNPLYELIWFTESLAFVFLPITLLTFRRKLKIDVLPWLFVSVFMIIGIFIKPFYPPYLDNVDPTVSSVFNYLLTAEMWTAVSMLISFGMAFALKKLRLFGVEARIKVKAKQR